jgi:hypothetical protein
MCFHVNIRKSYTYGARPQEPLRARHLRMLGTDGASFDVCPSQAMAALLSSLNLGQRGLEGSGMALVSSADSGRITPAENAGDGSRGVATSYDAMAPTRVRALLIIPVGCDMFNRGGTA